MLLAPIRNDVGRCPNCGGTGQRHCASQAQRAYLPVMEHEVAELGAPEGSCQASG
jgi:hypothetical protein